MTSYLSKIHLMNLCLVEGKKLQDIQETMFAIMETNHGRGEVSSFPKLFESWMMDRVTNDFMLKIMLRDIRACKGISKSMTALLIDLVKVLFSPAEFATVMEEFSGASLLPLLPPGYPIYLMSNYNGPAFAEIAKKFPDLMSVFTDVLVSGREGMMKPQKEIYELAMKRWNISDPSTVLYIDDEIENIHVARELGFETVHYTGFDAALVTIRGIVARHSDK